MHPVTLTMDVSTCHMDVSHVTHEIVWHPARLSPSPLPKMNCFFNNVFLKLFLTYPNISIRKKRIYLLHSTCGIPLNFVGTIFEFFCVSPCWEIWIPFFNNVSAMDGQAMAVKWYLRTPLQPHVNATISPTLPSSWVQQLQWEYY